jgi:hypothetical protein
MGFNQIPDYILISMILSSHHLRDLLFSRSENGWVRLWCGGVGFEPYLYLRCLPNHSLFFARAKMRSIELVSKPAC